MAKEKTVLQETMDMLNKKSANSVYILDENEGINIRRFSTGRLSLDIPIGGGLPEGRIIEIYGWESSGKTTATLHMIASYQSQGFVCAFIDYENAFDPVYARSLGVDTSKLVFSQPTTAEEGLDIIQELTNSGEVKLIVVDSVASMTPEKELMGESGDSVMGLHARLMSQAMRKLAGRANKTHTNIIFINQMREKIGVMFGDPRTTSGGNALKFYASIRIEFKAGKKNEAKGLNEGGLKVVKNKTYKPFETSTFDMEYGKGISEMTDLINYAEAAGVIKKAGSWYSYGETKLGQGTNGVSSTFEDNPELKEEIEVLVMAAYFPTPEQEAILNEK